MNISTSLYDLGGLVDIRGISVDTELSREEKILDYMRQFKTPHICRYGDMVIESVFAEGDVSLNDRLKQHLRMSKSV